jgi:hypothetical protein
LEVCSPAAANQLHLGKFSRRQFYQDNAVTVRLGIVNGIGLEQLAARQPPVIVGLQLHDGIIPTKGTLSKPKPRTDQTHLFNLEFGFMFMPASQCWAFTHWHDDGKRAKFLTALPEQIHEMASPSEFFG